MALPRFYKPEPYLPTEIEDDEPGLLSRGLNRLGQIAGTAGRGIDTLVNVGRGLAEEGDPLARFKLTPESQDRGLAGDVGGALGVVDPSIDQETVGSQIAEGAFGRPSEQDSYGTAIGREATRFAGDLARDPLTFVAGLGLGSKVAGGQKASRLLAEVPDMAPELARALSGAARTGQRAATAESIASGAFQGLMAGGAYEGGRAAYRTIRDEGFTPKAAGEATGALLAAGGLALPHLRHRDAGMPPDELSRITQILPNVTAEELGRREAFYSRRGMNEAVKAVQDELSRRNQILPKDSAGNISEGARVAVDAAEAMKVAEAPPTARTDTAGPYQAFLNRDVRPEPIPAAADAPFAADPPEQAYADFFARLESIKTPEEAQALVGEQADTALQAARKAGIPVAENQDALPAQPIIPGPDGGDGTLEGVAPPVTGGDQVPMGIAEAPVVEAPGVPTPASIAGNRAPEFVRLPAERLLWEQAVEAGVSPEQASKSIATPRGRSLLRDAVRGRGIPPVLPPGEKRLPAWEGKLFDPTNPPPSRPALIEQQAQAFSADPEAAQVFGDAARVVEAADARRLANQEAYAERKARKREQSMAEAERVLAVNAPQRLPLIPDVEKASVQPNQMGFYSQLQRVTEKLPQAMKGADLFRYLSDPKRGVKADELKWTGLDDFLRERAGQKVTKEDLQDFLDQNQVEVKEVTLGKPLPREAAYDKIAMEEYGKPYVELDDRQMAWVKSVAPRAGEPTFDTATKFSQYQLPGGENYREVLLTLPEKGGLPAGFEARQMPNGKWGVFGPGPMAENRYGSGATQAEAIKSFVGHGHTGAFKGGHFDEPNVLAHIRLNDRTDAQGKKVLFVEEIQSDWAQKGRREGFDDPEGRARLVREETAAMDRGDADEAIRIRETIRARERGHGIPSAPFVQKTEAWTELALKRILRMAAEEGYEKVAWTTGAQQVARYPEALRQVVDRITWTNVADDGSKFVQAKKGGETVFRGTLNADGTFHDYEAAGKHVEDVLGKGMAEKVLGTKEAGQIEGKDFTVGGKGMEGYYDQIVPSVASKLGKKFGAKVGQTRIGTGPLEYTGSARIASNGREYWVEADGRRLTGTFDSAAKAMDARDGLKNQQQPVHSIDVTPQMRESVVKEGLPLFATSPTGAGTPKRLSFDDVQANFRGRKVEPTETGFSVQLPNGHRILVEHSGAIDFSPEALKAGHGERVAAGVSEGTQKIAGAYRRVNGESVIQVAEQGILPHEVLHAFMDHVASPKERRLLEQQYAEKAKGEGRDWEEVAADDYKDYFNRRRAAEAEGKSVVEKGLFERLWAKFYEFFRSAYRSIAPNKEWIQEQLYAGKPWERESVQPGPKADQFASERVRAKIPTQNEIVSVLREHPLIKLKEKVRRAYVVGSQATGETRLPGHGKSDVDILLEVEPRRGVSPEQLEEKYRKALREHFVKNNIRGVDDSQHPQWDGHRVDVYFTYDASGETRPKVLLSDAPTKYATTPTAPQTPAPAVPTTPEATLGEKVVEGYKAGLVSGPGTQVANIVGNVGEQGVRSAETLASSIVDRLLPGERQRYTGETGAELKGLFSKMPQAMGQLSKDLKDVFTLAPETVDPTAPIERRQGAIGGKTGRGVRIPFRLLGAFDNFFGTIGKEAELQKLAFRQAKSELKNADAATVKARAQEIAQNPSEALLKETERAKASRLFKGDPDNPDELIQALINLRKKNKALEVVLPFIETPANIAKLTIQRSPLGFAQAAKAYRVYKAAVAKGADSATTQKLRGEAVDAIARPLLGSVLLGSFYGLAKGGSMTGSGPSDSREKSLLRQTGWQPYSFVIGEGKNKTYIPFNRFEPLSSFLGFAADAAESQDTKTTEELVNKAMGSVVSNLTSKTYLQGVADAAEFINDPSRFASSYLSSVSSAAVPNIVAKAAQAVDPTLRDVTPESAGIAGLPERIGNTLLSRIPGASSTLPARRSATGDPIQREGNALSRFLSPVQASTRRPEMRLEELMVEAGEVPGQPSREFTVPGTGGKKVRLTDSEYAVLQEANLNAATSLRSRMGALERMDPEARAKVIKSTYERARDFARSKLIGNRGFRERARREVAV